MPTRATIDPRNKLKPGKPLLPKKQRVTLPPGKRTPSNNRASSKRIAVLGAGKIGAAIVELLQDIGGYRVKLADRDAALLKLAAGPGVETKILDVLDPCAVVDFLQGCQAVLSALPYSLTADVARVARSMDVHYFDLTEDVTTTRTTRTLAKGARSVLMPQCGLAPGFISIVAMDLARRFDRLESVRMRVGALPVYPTNSLAYNLTWSTDGLINEYCNPCEAIHEGRRMEVLPLQQIEHFAFDGITYEAFNTSGGLGTLCETLDGQLKELNYKTVRYPGHCERMQLLCDELRLGSRRELFKDVLESAIPMTSQDVVLIFVTVTGYREHRLTQESYATKIYSRSVRNKIWSAIQLTTASEICAMADLVLQGELPAQGFLKQEDVPLATFLNNRFGRLYVNEHS